MYFVTFIIGFIVGGLFVAILDQILTEYLEGDQDES